MSNRCYVLGLFRLPHCHRPSLPHCHRPSWPQSLIVTRWLPTRWMARVCWLLAAVWGPTYFKHLFSFWLIVRGRENVIHYFLLVEMCIRNPGFAWGMEVAAKHQWIWTSFAGQLKSCLKQASLTAAIKPACGLWWTRRIYRADRWMHSLLLSAAFPACSAKQSQTTTTPRLKFSFTTRVAKNILHLQG